MWNYLRTWSKLWKQNFLGTTENREEGSRKLGIKKALEKAKERACEGKRLMRVPMLSVLSQRDHSLSSQGLGVLRGPCLPPPRATTNSLSPVYFLPITSLPQNDIPSPCLSPRPRWIQTQRDSSGTGPPPPGSAPEAAASHLGHRTLFELRSVAWEHRG